MANTSPVAAFGEVKGQPVNQEFLSPLGFKFQLLRMPTVEFFCQKVKIPRVSIGKVSVNTPLGTLPMGGDHAVFEDFKVTFKVDEDLKNYEEIFDWMMALAPQTRFGGKDTDNPNYIINQKSSQIAGIGRLSDSSVMILTNLMNPNIQFKFHDMVPLDLGELNFETTPTNIDYITCDGTFQYRNFTIHHLT